MVTIRVPASSANLGTGFDTLGLALQLYLSVTAYDTEGRAALSFAEPDGGDLLHQAMAVVFSQAGLPVPKLKLEIKSQIPAGKGLGSSAAVIVAGLYLANHLLSYPFSEQQLLNWALALEGHPDNIAPAVAGGLTTAMVLDGELFYQKVSLQDDLKVIIAVPDFTLPTGEARRVLPEKVYWRDCVRHLQQACFVMQSLATGDYRHLARAMDDEIVQPARQSLIPGLKEVIKTALQRGALGAALSGAGPSVIALADSNWEYIGSGMQEAFRDAGCQSRCLYLDIDHQGVQIIKPY
jgi:homoserine kinase